MTLRIKKTLVQRYNGKSSLARLVRGVVTTSIVLATLLGMGGVAYAWYMSEYGEASKPATVYVKSKGASKTIRFEQVNVQLQPLAAQVAPGEKTTAAVKTNAEAKCSIDVEYNKIKVVDLALAPVTADKNGVASWTWTVAPTAPEGSWPIEIRCANQNDSETVKGSLIVSKKKPEAETRPKEVAKPVATTWLGVVIQSISSPVAPGDTTSVTVKATPAAKCTILVINDNGKVVDPALVPKNPDTLGVVGWVWAVAANAPVGSWPVEVTCADQNNASTAKGVLVVRAPQSQSQ